MDGRCVPYRVNKKDDEGGNPCSSLGDDTAAEVEVLMISTPNRADMVFPKVREGSYMAAQRASSA
jgi:diphosphoinositol-polyphosphate diphosphatase